jgi:hypothetical protein
LLRRPPRPLSAVLAEAKERRVEATIEGHVLERVLVDVQASGIQVITFEDATASVRVLVQPETPGHSEASWIGWRLQIDLVGGPEAQREAKRVLEAEPGRRARAPEGDYLLPVAIRLVQQGAWMAPRGGTAAIP